MGRGAEGDNQGMEAFAANQQLVDDAVKKRGRRCADSEPGGAADAARRRWLDVWA